MSLGVPVSLPVCSCVHGVCSRGPLGDGSCVCFAGYTGPRCDQGGRGCWQPGAAGPQWPEQERPLGEGWDPSLYPQPNFFLRRRGTELVRGREGRLRPPAAHRPGEGRAPATVNKWAERPCTCAPPDLELWAPPRRPSPLRAASLPGPELSPELPVLCRGPRLQLPAWPHAAGQRMPR